MIDKIAGKLRTINALFYALILFFIFTSLIKLETAPPLWWDEGWTLQVARNWVEQGHYGQIMGGERLSAGLSGHFPVVASIALSFKLFGVGIWQGRLPSLIYTFVSLILIYILAWKLYNRKIATATLFLLVFTSVDYDFNPLLFGRQVMGEMPMLTFLLAGYLFFYLALSGQYGYVILSAIMWGLALQTKSQAAPFWLASLLLPILIVLMKRWWKSLFLIFAGLIGTWLSSQFWEYLKNLILANKTSAGEPLNGLYNVTAFVLDPNTRLLAILGTLTIGLPVLLGLLWAFSKEWLILKDVDVDFQNREITRIMIWGLSASWFAWYIFFAAFFVRYLFPPKFVSSIFFALLLHDLTRGFKWRWVSKRLRLAVLRPKFNRRTLLAWIAFLWTFVAVFSTVRSYEYFFLSPNHDDPIAVAAYLNTNTPADSLIETYDSELFFLIDRPYHYPPDAAHIELNHRWLYSEYRPLDYDPLAADPDYLVVGPFSNWWMLYDDLLMQGDFRLVQVFPGYDIYERVR